MNISKLQFLKNGLSKKQKMFLITFCFLTLIFFISYFSIFFTSQTILFNTRDKLNDNSPQIQVYYNDVLHTEPNIYYSIDVKITGEWVGVYVYEIDDTRHVFRLGDLPEDTGDDNIYPKSLAVEWKECKINIIIKN